MKTIMIPAALLFLATGAQAQQGGLPGTAPGAASAPTTGTVDASTTKPKGQIVTLTKPTERRSAGVRAHCFNGSVYWTPKLEEGRYYCEGADAPTPSAQ